MRDINILNALYVPFVYPKVLWRVTNEELEDNLNRSMNVAFQNVGKSIQSFGQILSIVIVFKPDYVVFSKIGARLNLNNT